MLTCNDLTELVTDYLEGRLPLMRRLELQMHLGMCVHCRAYLRQMKMTVRTLGKLPETPMPDDVREALLARFRNVRRPADVEAASRASPGMEAVAALERWLGRGRGWGPVAAIVMFGTVLAILFGGEAGSIHGEGCARCLVTELGGAVVAIATAAAVAMSLRVRLSSSTLAALAAVGGFAGYLALTVVCPSFRVIPHTLVVHVGGLVIASSLGAAASLLPTVRGG